MKYALSIIREETGTHIKLSIAAQTEDDRLFSFSWCNCGIYSCIVFAPGTDVFTDMPEAVAKIDGAPKNVPSLKEILRIIDGLVINYTEEGKLQCNF